MPIPLRRVRPSALRDRMVQSTSDRILEVIRSFANGATRQQILEKLGGEGSGRTLTRYLSLLHEGGQVRSERDGHEMRYFFQSATPRRSPKKPAENPPGMSPTTLATRPKPGQVARSDASAGPGQDSPASTGDSAPAPALPAGEEAGSTTPGSPAEPCGTHDGPAAEPPIAPTSPSTAPFGQPAPAPAPELDAVIEMFALDVVLGGVTRPGAVLMARQLAATYNRQGEASAALVKRALQRIDRITYGDVQDAGVTSAQFATWQSRWSGDYSADTKDQSVTKGQAPSETGKAGGGTQNGESAIPSMQPEARHPPSDRGPNPAARNSRSHLRARRGTAARDGSSVGSDVSLSRDASPAAIATVATKALAQWLDRLAPGLPPAFRQLLFWAFVTLLPLLAAAAAQYRWLPAVVALAVIAVILGAVAVSRRRRDVGANVPFQARSRPTAPDGGAHVAGRQDGGELPPGHTVASQPTVPIERAGEATVRWGVLVVAAFSIIGCVAAVWYGWPEARPSNAAIADYLASSAAPLPVRVVSLSPSYSSVTSTSSTLTYQAVLETTAPLYRRLDTTEYLRSHAATQLAAFDAADTVLRGADGAGIPEDLKAQLSKFKSGSSAPVLVTTSTPTGATTVATGVLLAWRRAGNWAFTVQQGGFDRTRFAGEAKPGSAFAVDDPTDLARLNAWIAEQAACAAKVTEAAAALAAERERRQQQQAGAFAQMLQPGTLFTGTIVDPIRATQQRVIVEITAGSDQQLSAVLRNDGGWSDARAFTGSWTLAPAGDAAVLVLRTSRSDWIDGAGPLLEDRNDYAITLHVRADGMVTSTPGNTRMQRVTPANAGAVRDDVLRPLAAAISATAAGRVYRGTARPRLNGPAESLLLRFRAGSDLSGEPRSAVGAGSETPAGAAAPSMDIAATLESATVGGRGRAFRGAIISNKYRVGETPIRLKSDDAERVAAAGDRSPLGLNTTNNSLLIALRADVPRLVGQDNWFTYEFTPAEPGASAPTTIPAYDPQPPPNASPAGAGGDEAGSLPPYPSTPGAYVLNAGAWWFLPRNEGRVIEVMPGVNGGVGQLIFYGKETVPIAAAGEVTLLYVGRLEPLYDATVKKFPHLKADPRFEVAELVLESGIVRDAVVAELAQDFTGFGTLKIPLKLEQPAVDVTQLRCMLRAGRYALACGAQFYEFAIQ